MRRVLGFCGVASLLRGKVFAPQTRRMASVSGLAYSAESKFPVVSLYTKEACTLCDEVKAVLARCREETPHSLELVDITDDRDVWEAYKYDIPVVHVDGNYWTKHRLSEAEARSTLEEAAQDKLKGKPFQPRPGRPNAAAMEL